MDQTFVNRIDLATVAAFEETLCEANHIKPAPGGTKMSRRATTAAVRPRVLRRVLANRSQILQKEPKKFGLLWCVWASGEPPALPSHAGAGKPAYWTFQVLHVARP
jgi:hypothetical protein